MLVYWSAILHLSESKYDIIITNTIFLLFRVSSVNQVAFEDAFKVFKQNVLKQSSQVVRITIRRSHLWDDTLRLYNKGIYCERQLKVSFLGEPAIDLGGPKREYFTLLMRAIVNNSMLFDGPLDMRIPKVNASALIENRYYMIGRMMAASIIHDCSLPTFLARSIVQYFFNGLSSVTPDIDEVFDKDMQGVLHQVCDV